MLSGCLKPDSIALKDCPSAELPLSAQQEQTTDAATAASNDKKLYFFIGLLFLI
jgi:hypothetical protein